MSIDRRSEDRSTWHDVDESSHRGSLDTTRYRSNVAAWIVRGRPMSIHRRREIIWHASMPLEARRKDRGARVMPPEARFEDREAGGDACDARLQAVPQPSHAGDNHTPLLYVVHSRRRRLLSELVVLGTLLTTLLAHVPATTGDLAADPSVRAGFWKLVTESRYGFARTEEAMFVVRGAGGAVTFVRWPDSGLHHQARWIGPFPPGTIAIVHTHPNWVPEPSAIDTRLAERIGIPVYVVTRTRISRTAGGVNETLVSSDWRPVG
jgi:hypothetical protein